MTALALRLGHPLSVLRPTLHNGPGWRVALWFQGCSLRCTTDCLNPHLLSPQGGFEFAVAEVLAAVQVSQRWLPEPIEGITILGGEPLDQLIPLTELLAQAQAVGLTTMLYTGWSLEALDVRFGQAAASQLLASVDLLKAGPYMAGRYSETLPWRGSSNQQIHCLSSRYTPASLAEAWSRQGKGTSTLAGTGPHAIRSASGLQSRPAARQAESEILTPPN